MQRFLVIFALLISSLVMVGCSDATSTAQDLSPQQYVSQFTEANVSHMLVDVRTPEEFASGHIAGAVNIPLDQISSRLSEMPQDGTLVVYCRSGNRSAQAISILQQAGYAKLYDLGGIISWVEAGYPVQ